MSKELRSALGSFVSGITVVTCSEADAQPVGVTVSSFCSLSLEPPMVLWCLDAGARSRQAFTDAEFFAVHVLASDQWNVAETFATRGADKFSALEWAMSEEGAPLLAHFATRFLCKRSAVHEGGDHLIVTGEIKHYDATDHKPLAYHQGRYALVHRDDEAAHLMAWQSW